MSALAIAMILFACVFLAHCLGCFFGAVLPRASFESVARDVVRVAMAMVSAERSLVLMWGIA